MACTHLLDTSIYSQPIKNRPNQRVLDRWSRHPLDATCISSVCLAEVLQGLEERDSDIYWRRYREILENQVEALPFDTEVARTYGRLAAMTRKAGRPRPAMDLLVAATAVHHNLILATLNVRDVEGIPGLTIENWGEAPETGPR